LETVGYALSPFGLVAAKPKGVDWSWPGRIMPAKSGWREGTKFSDFGSSRQKTSNDKVSLAENTVHFTEK
jgi:hypothetical protein